MYHCRECHTPMTEFDVFFSEKLYPNEGTSEHKCFRCVTKGKMAETLNKHNKRKNIIKEQLAPLRWAIIGGIIIGIIAAVAFYFDHYTELDSHSSEGEVIVSVLTIIGFIGCFFLIIAVIRFLVSDYRIVRYITGADEPHQTSYTEYEYYESTVQSDGSIRTEKKTSSTSNDDMLPALFQLVSFLTFPLWWIPYLIYSLIRCKTDLNYSCPKEVISAYRYANRKAPKVVLSKSSEEYYQQQCQNYTAKIEKIKNKYGILGQDRVEEKINQLKVPVFLTRSKNAQYVVAQKRNGRNNKPDIYFLLCKEKGELCGKVLVGDRFLYSNSGDWGADWRGAGAKPDTFDAIEYYQTFL